MNKINSIKTPRNNLILYDKEKKILIVVGSKEKKYIRTNNFFFINKEKKELNEMQLNANKKRRKNIANRNFNSCLNVIKKYFIETNTIFYKKLKLIGIGYKINSFDKEGKNAFNLKLGLSHSLYLNKSNFETKICLNKFTKIFIFGSSYFLTTQMAALIRSIKKPEPYKGKGILYSDEIIAKKRGKKI